jgi:hypothetical protein
MADVEMYEQEEVAPPKKGLPAWLWVCGSGCLLLVVATILLGVWGVGKFKELADPEKGWEALAEILPYEERPTDLEFQWRWNIGMDMFILEHADGYMAILMRFPAQDAEASREQLFDPEFTGSVMGFGGRKNAEAGKYTVQGREVDVLHFDQQGSSKSQGGGPSVGPGRSIYVDLTPAGKTRPLVLQLIRKGEGGNFSAEEVTDFLAPFDVWGGG